MFRFFKSHKLILFIPLAFWLYNWSFENTAIFWYMYPFAILVLMSASIVFSKISDELPTWKSLIFGLGYGTLIYGIIALGYRLLQFFPIHIDNSVSNFLAVLAPTSIWHYLLLMFIIVPGEEVFWRGFVQQQLKRYMPTFTAILLSSVLFGLALGVGGFWPGQFAGLAAGLVLGALYEWKRSMPLIIIAHLVMIVLLFLVQPLPMP
ncbi:CPBP family intramembrane glutamic endopeptidase [Planomicrobium sp. CPCC 101079]|uniref:CPBP family intramembrane glutamic endopeptidase n=1 Tax=Planomicrobium sp. CPCC 101079 TaxID=2599618 RepID=UPI0011B7ABFC|nr:type II CAAX endopeptidase family protein [Planomicrobium sp. CPCC 101079]TWT04807.1 CPBP family intramembrane metalloprotease [Planomicrobium sp. CPCC 101079]